jgi:hypothetical protein
VTPPTLADATVDADLRQLAGSGRLGIGLHSGTWTRPGSTKSNPAKNPDLGGWPQHQQCGRPFIDRPGLAHRSLGMEVRGPVRQRQVTARRKPISQARDDAPRVLLIGAEVHDRDEQDPIGWLKVNQFLDVGVGQDRLGLAQVGQHNAGVPSASEQGAVMRVHDWVIIHVDDPDVRRDLLGDLVHVTGRRNPDGYRKLCVVSIRVKLGILSYRSANATLPTHATGARVF